MLTYSIDSATPLPDGLSLDAPYPDMISGTIPITGEEKGSGVVVFAGFIQNTFDRGRKRGLVSLFLR
ncbi:MAG: hypothetical protein EXS16_06380 [Gemmataceae bacterium]|nr:hypothetical protein [Gemmataceae bacterium]